MFGFQRRNWPKPRYAVYLAQSADGLNKELVNWTGSLDGPLAAGCEAVQWWTFDRGGSIHEAGWKKNSSGWWFQSYFPLTFIFFKMVKTTNQSCDVFLVRKSRRGDFLYGYFELGVHWITPVILGTPPLENFGKDRSKLYWSSHLDEHPTYTNLIVNDCKPNQIHCRTGMSWRYSTNLIIYIYNWVIPCGYHPLLKRLVPEYHDKFTSLSPSCRWAQKKYPLILFVGWRPKVNNRQTTGSSSNIYHFWSLSRSQIIAIN